jgi:hypothetical protein
MITAVIAGISALASLYGGISSANAARSEAQRAQQYAAYNSINSMAWGREQAMMTLMSAAYNSKLIKAQAAYNANLRSHAIEYNVKQMREVSAYNSLLSDAELESLYDSLELDTELARKQAKYNQGAELARQAASGTVMGEGSNAEVLTQMLADEEMQYMIMDANAENRALSIVNAQAQGEWETEMQINKMRYEGMLAGAGELYSAYANAGAQAFQGFANAVAQERSGRNSGQSMLWQGMQTADRYNQQASTYLTNGIFGAGRSLASSYGSGAFNSLLTD